MDTYAERETSAASDKKRSTRNMDTHGHIRGAGDERRERWTRLIGT